MSGSGGGGYVPPIGRKLECAATLIKVTVASVDMQTLSKHSVGDLIDVRLSENEIVVLEDGDGEFLGSVVHLDTVELIKCLKRGFKFKAKILSINFPMCRVQITSE